MVKLRNGKLWVAFLSLLVLAAAFRVAVAHWLPNDAPDDGRIYSQIARNVLEQHVYSHESAAPFVPSLIRLPGYPLFLASIYSIFGHTSNGAVRIVQALIDTATCGLIALLAFYWQPDEQKKRASAIAALVLAAICPFTTIYAATILTEVPTNFLIMAMLVATTLALRESFTTEDTEEAKRKHFKRVLLWWIVAGLIGGIAVFFRPDNGLFVAAVGLTLVVAGMSRVWSAPAERSGEGALESADSSALSKAASSRRTPKGRFAQTVMQTLLCGALFSIAFAIVLTPW